MWNCTLAGTGPLHVLGASGSTQSPLIYRQVSAWVYWAACEIYIFQEHTDSCPSPPLQLDISSTDEAEQPFSVVFNAPGFGLVKKVKAVNGGYGCLGCGGEFGSEEGLKVSSSIFRR